MKAFFKSILYAVNGIRASFAEQPNLRAQAIVACIVVIAGVYFRISTLEWSVVLIVIALVICLEMINSAIEDLVDLVTTDWKPAAGKIKDIAAGAVVVASIIAVIVGVIVFGKYI